jgi:outer membrane lipoprotein-sorting protein
MIDRQRVAASLALCLAVLVTIPAAVSAEEPSKARQILDHVDDLFRGDASHGHATMVIKTEHWARTLELEFWSQGKERSLIRILAPEKEKGTATLKVGNDLWNYLPKVKRVVKLPSSMLSASWMGSHLTNDDLVKESRMADDYTFEVTFDGERDGEPAIEITCIPKPDAAIVWGKVVVRVRRDGWMPLRVAFYGEDMDLARTAAYTDVQEMGGRRLPTTMTFVPAHAPDEYTRIHYDSIVFDPPLDDDLFSLRTLQR